MAHMDGNPEGYRPHNIFDMNLPSSHPAHHSHSHSHHQHNQHGYPNAGNGGSPFMNDGYNGGGPLDKDFHGHNPTFAFNSTIPALSNRYAEPEFAFGGPTHQASSPDGLSRSRSHSRDGWAADRPASSGGLSNTSSTTSQGPPSTAGGPVRRSRRDRNSFSSTSPPPTAFRRNPGAITIPRTGSVGGAQMSPMGMPGSASSESFGLGPGTPQDIMQPFHMGPQSSSPPDHHFNSYHPLPPLHEHHHGIAYKSSSPPHQAFHNMPSSYSYGSSASMSYQPASGFPISSSHPSPPLSTSVPTATANTPATKAKKDKEKDREDKAAILASEKKRRRRESHNAVERRRRDNINEKISELATLIPECMLDGSVEPGLPNQANVPTSPLLPGATPATIPEEPALSHPNANADLGTAGEGQSAGVLNTFGLGSLDPLPPESPISPILPPPAGVAASTNGGSPPGNAGGEAQVVKANKGMILRKSVDYIRYLQQLVSVQGARNRELEAELRAVKGSGGPSSSGSFAMSGTMGLGFGMGSMGMMTFPSQPQGATTPKPIEDDIGVNSQTSTLKPGDAKMNNAGTSDMQDEGMSPLTSDDGNVSEGVKMEEVEHTVERGRRRERDAMES